MQQQTFHGLPSSDKLAVIVWVPFFESKECKIDWEGLGDPIILNNLSFWSHYWLVFFKRTSDE